MVSVGELGIRPEQLEMNLKRILDIAYTWRAVLLIDEADVFLAQREDNDIGRSALVSIFLRLLEYFEGILFLTTNRGASFDEAFISRVHISIRYDKLEVKTKKAIWKLFIDRVRLLPDAKVAEMTEENWTKLANYELNGREVRELPLAFRFAFAFLHLIDVWRT